MNNTNMDDLLKLLNETTEDCDKINIITESTDTTIGIIQKRLYGLQNTLLDNMSSKNPNYMTPDTIDLIKKVQQIEITEAHKIMTYPNIHNEKKYDIKAGVMINYVLNKLDYNFAHDIDFESKDLLDEAVAYTYKKMTGETIGSKLEINEFREKYRIYALGGGRRVHIYPKIATLIKLATKSPYIINYIDDRLIYKHIRSLRNYANELNHRFGQLVRKNPKLKNKLNKYISCVESAIKYITRMYKDIRTVMFELDVEYRRIFREIISIDNDVNSKLSESIEFNPVIYDLNKVYKELSNLSNDIIIESSSGEHILKESESLNIKESLLNANRYFLTNIIGKLKSREDTLNYIKSSAGLVSNVTQNDCNEYPVYTYSNINNMLITNIKNASYKYMKDRSSDINELVTGKELAKEILCTVDLLKDSYSELENGPWLVSTLNNIQTAFYGNNKYITLDVESLANNLIIIPNILEDINETMILIYKNISDKIGTFTNKIKNGKCDNIKEEITKTVNYYCVYNEILNCIYECLQTLALASISGLKCVIKNKLK